ncbi:GMP synthase-Glutamine amidotransferase [Cryobacterium flavum]|uniref:GMP synthase-Glutamine amidotransferase n=1 Tax=Cryobacterium flavum TaxID=1424659 RepID=A0A4V3I8V9_9MICO|nr:type 1 glutamine amidotransferase [Cryobacterium flavum]SDO28788.1 GMP synthase-Glutamine amidotransferase [Cryobacterium flavum]
MTVKRILVVEHEANAGVGLVGERILAAGIDLVRVGPDAGAPIPGRADGFDGVVVLGGTTGPTDDERAAWLPRVRELIADCLQSEVPLLGICLGAQMLAVVAGGTVGRARRGAEIGLSGLELTDSAAADSLLHDLPSPLRALQWHSLEVHDLPANSVSLCTSDRCPNQAFRVGPAAWGLQFHLEASAATAEAWAESDSDDLRAAGYLPEHVIDPMRENEDDLRRVWSEVADRWIGLV